MPDQRNARRHRGGGGRDEPSDDDGNPPPPPPPEPRHPQAPNIPRGGQSIANSGSPSGFMESTFRSYGALPHANPQGNPRISSGNSWTKSIAASGFASYNLYQQKLGLNFLKKFSLRS